MIKDKLLDKTANRFDVAINAAAAAENRSEPRWDYGRNLSHTDDEYDKKQETKKNQWTLLRKETPPSAGNSRHINSDGFFCEAPSKCSTKKNYRILLNLSDSFGADPEYAHFVVQRVNRNRSESLFNANGLRAMCDIENQLTETENYDELCERHIHSNSCCRPWSLPNYVALLANRSSCHDIEVSVVNFHQTK